MAKDKGFTRQDAHPTATWRVPAQFGNAFITAMADADTPTQRDPAPEVEGEYKNWRHPMPTRFDLTVGADEAGSVTLNMSFLEAQALYLALGQSLNWDGQ